MDEVTKALACVELPGSSRSWVGIAPRRPHLWCISINIEDRSWFAAARNFGYESNKTSQAYVPQSTKFVNPYFSGATL